MSSEILRIVDGIAKDRNIDREVVFEDLEAAMVSAARKYFSHAEDVRVQIDRKSGQITASCDGKPISMRHLGRIAAQTAKQVMIQKIREAERGSIFEEFVEREGTIVTGTVARHEGGAIVVTIGRAEALLPRSEQIPGETFRPGQRLRAIVLDVRESGSQVKIVLSRTHPDFIRRLFELEVPEAAEKIIQIHALAREAGYRTKVAVSSIDTKVDAVGACVGIRGSRIKSIVDELGGEKIDIVRWNESSTILIGNALKPAEVNQIALCFELGRATVVVDDDQLSLAIGKRGQNVRLAARLTGWDIDIITPAEYNAGLERLEQVLKKVFPDDTTLLGKIVALGMVSLSDVAEVGPDPLISELGFSEEVSTKIVQACAEAAEQLRRETEEAKEQAKRFQAAGEGHPEAVLQVSQESGPVRARFSARAGTDAEAQQQPSPSESEEDGEVVDSQQ